MKADDNGRVPAFNFLEKGQETDICFLRSW